MTICTYVERIGRTYIFLKKYKEKVATYTRVYTVKITNLISKNIIKIFENWLDTAILCRKPLRSLEGNTENNVVE